MPSDEPKTRVLKDHAFEETTHEVFPCIQCGKPVGLYFNGGELDSSKCCGVTYYGHSVGYQIVCEDPSHG